jgi:DNA-binding XRE family transcriptional regulator
VSPRVDPIERVVGRRVRVLRTAAGLTQQELARRAKISAKFVSLVETGKVNTSIGVLSRVAAAVGIPLSTFFTTTSPTPSPTTSPRSPSLVSAQPKAARKQAFTCCAPCGASPRRDLAARSGAPHFEPLATSVAARQQRSTRLVSTQAANRTCATTPLG